MNVHHLVAVYGSLKQGQYNHDLLHGAEFIGEDKLYEYTLYDLGPFPAVKRGSSAGVFVEVYRVNTAQLHRLDQLEGFFATAPERSLYLRVKVESAYGPVWVYEYNADVDPHSQIDSGNWRPV